MLELGWEIALTYLLIFNSHRERTKQIYTVYSRRSSVTIHATLRDLQADYVIVEDIWCHRQYRPGCAFHEVTNQSSYFKYNGTHEESRKNVFFDIFFHISKINWSKVQISFMIS